MFRIPGSLQACLVNDVYFICLVSTIQIHLEQTGSIPKPSRIAKLTLVITQITKFSCRSPRKYGILIWPKSSSKLVRSLGAENDGF